MASLMDALKKNLQGPQAAPQLGQTERVRSLTEGLGGQQLSADSGPARTSIQEKSAAAQTQAGLDDQSLQNKLMGQNLQTQSDAQESQAEEARLNLGDQMEGYRSQFEAQSDNLLKEFERDTRQLDDSRQAAKLEQLGFTMRLQDSQYLNQLKQQGELSRLSSSVGFKEAAARSVLADNLSLFKSDLAFKTFYNSTDRDFRAQISQLNIDFAVQLADRAMKAESEKAIFTGLGNLASTGAQYYASNQNKG